MRTPTFSTVKNDKGVFKYSKVFEETVVLFARYEQRLQKYVNAMPLTAIQETTVDAALVVMKLFR
jgi:hypothetical protein